MPVSDPVVTPDAPPRTLVRRSWALGLAAGAILFAAAVFYERAYGTVHLAGTPLWQILVLAGILFLSGLMSGLSGFGFSAIGSSCLLLLSPKIGVPLLMALSTANQLMSVGQLKEDMPKSWPEAWPNGSGPYVLGGMAGVPLGIWLLNHLPASRLMLIFGVILTVYSVYSILKPSSLKVRGSSRPSGGVAVGFLGGTIGGFTAFPGAAVVVWTGLQNLPKRLTRSIVQPYILVLQILSLVTNAYAHPSVFSHRFWELLGLMIPIVLPGTVGGVFLYRSISDVNFRRISFFLLGVSGVGLLVKVLMK